MKGIIDGRFVIKPNSYIINLRDVDFITFKENENELGTYWIKFHMGGKEARYVCESVEDLQKLLQLWTTQLGMSPDKTDDITKKILAVE